MSALTRFLRKRSEKQAENPKIQSGLYKILSNIGTFGSFTAIALVVIGWFDVITMSSFMSGIIATIAIISVGCLMFLPWLRNFENNKNKKVSIVFMILVIICTILWIVCAYMTIHLSSVSKYAPADKNTQSNTLNLIKITLIVSIQFLVSSLIASNIIKYGKQILPLQIISYLSYLFFDFYLTCFLLCIKITPSNGLEISKTINFLFNKVMYVLFFLSIIYMLLSSKIMKSVDERRVSLANNKENLETTNQQKPESRLEKLQSMLDNKLITQEEFDKKRKEILKDL